MAMLCRGRQQHQRIWSPWTLMIMIYVVKGPDGTQQTVPQQKRAKRINLMDFLDSGIER